MSVGSTGPVSPLPPSGQKPPPVKLDEVLKKLLKNADKDGDGQLDQGEFAAVAGALNALMPAKPGESTNPTEMFTQADSNNDGKVSLDELKSFVVDRISQGVQAMDKGMQSVADGKGTAFSAVATTNGMQLSPDMQLQVMQMNLTQTMTSRSQGAVDGYSNQAYSTSSYFKADDTQLI